MCVCDGGGCVSLQLPKNEGRMKRQKQSGMKEDRREGRVEHVGRGKELGGSALLTISGNYMIES